MDKEKLKKLLIKANDIEKGKGIALAKEFIQIDEKLDSTKSEIIQTIKDIPEVVIPEPKEIPEFPTEMSINNLPDTQKVEVVNFPKPAEIKAPTVNIAPPVVNVEAPVVNIDTETIENKIEETNKILSRISDKTIPRKEIEKVTLVDEKGKPFKIQFPENNPYGGSTSTVMSLKNTGGNQINPATSEKQDEIITAVGSGYKISDIEDATTSYFGYLKGDGGWYILKLTATEARYIKGDSSYTTNWTNRSILSYDYYNNVF